MDVNALATRLAVPALWLVIVGIAYTLATGVLYFVTPPENAAVSNTTRQAPTATRPAPDINAVLTAHLFGEAGAVAAVDTSQPEVATRLPLDLLGVFVADQPDNSAAIISQRGRRGILYSIGESVPGDADLLEVHANHVVLRRAGTRETLHFPVSGEGLATSSIPAGAPIDDYPSNDYPANDYPANDYVEEYPEAYPEEEYMDDHGEESAEASIRDMVDDYREVLEENPEQAMDALGVSPVAEGSAEGYRIGDLAQSPYLSQTGLQPGDVILSVNGRPVGDLNQDRQELSNVLAQGSARLEVQRGSRRFFVTASLQ